MRLMFTVVNIYFPPNFWAQLTRQNEGYRLRGMEDSKIIDYLGGTNKVAALCSLHKSSISQWRKRGIPGAWRMYLQKIRPSAFRQGKAA